jgi:hypothetical protein
MGSVTSSTPIAVGQASSNGLSGSANYSENTWKRPQLVYVGADDGMLHAFFAGFTGSKTFTGGTYPGTYYAGEEAFAFIPNDMLKVITKLYAQGGQNLSADQKIVPGATTDRNSHHNLLADKVEHIFGLAGSPKVKDMCLGDNCADSDGTDWHTVLVMPEGPGGNRPFALDITNVISETAFNALTTGARTSQGTAGGSLMWSAALSTGSDLTAWDKYVGETTSVPAFYLRASSAADNRVLFASGYPTEDRGNSSYQYQGLGLLDIDAKLGTVNSYHGLASGGASGCTQQRVVLADVAIARNWATAATSQNLVAAYVADTWGNTYQYVGTTGSIPLVDASLGVLGCGHPLHFSPAVVQLDRLSAVDTSAKGDIYLVQVTNSNLDPDTRKYTHTPAPSDPPNAAGFPGSKLVVTKLNSLVNGQVGGTPRVVTSYNNTGQIILSTDEGTPDVNRICLQTTNTTNFTDGLKTKNQSCTAAGGGLLPPTARPVGTPTAVLRSDGLGFQVIASWYDATASANNCSGGAYDYNYGTSYITVHDFGIDGTWYQIAGVTLTNTALTGATFIGAGIFVDGIMSASGGGPQSISQYLGESFVSAQQLMNGGAALERYSRTSWSESF